jgi:hypothetical protein
VLGGLSLAPVPLGLTLVMEAVLVVPPTRAPDPRQYSSDRLEHAGLPNLLRGQELSGAGSRSTAHVAHEVGPVGRAQLLLESAGPLGLVNSRVTPGPGSRPALGHRRSDDGSGKEQDPSTLNTMVARLLKLSA